MLTTDGTPATTGPQFHNALFQDTQYGSLREQLLSCSNDQLEIYPLEIDDSSGGGESPYDKCLEDGVGVETEVPGLGNAENEIPCPDNSFICLKINADGSIAGRELGFPSDVSSVDGGKATIRCQVQNAAKDEVDIEVTTLREKYEFSFKSLDASSWFIGATQLKASNKGPTWVYPTDGSTHYGAVPETSKYDIVAFSW